MSKVPDGPSMAVLGQLPFEPPDDRSGLRLDPAALSRAGLSQTTSFPENALGRTAFKPTKSVDDEGSGALS
jgi:hypothetical protein